VKYVFARAVRGAREAERGNGKENSTVLGLGLGLCQTKKVVHDGDGMTNPRNYERWLALSWERGIVVVA